MVYRFILYNLEGKYYSTPLDTIIFIFLLFKIQKYFFWEKEVNKIDVLVAYNLLCKKFFQSGVPRIAARPKKYFSYKFDNFGKKILT